MALLARIETSPEARAAKPSLTRVEPVLRAELVEPRRARRMYLRVEFVARLAPLPAEATYSQLPAAPPKAPQTGLAHGYAQYALQARALEPWVPSGLFVHVIG